MNLRRFLLIIVTIMGASPFMDAVPPRSSVGGASSAAQEGEFFDKQVRPILAERCFSCHGEQKQKGDLRLDSRQALLKGNDAGPVIVIGDPEKSRLIQAIRHDGDLKMPPKDKLPDKEIEALTAWVKMGAPWPQTAAEREVAAKSEARKQWAFQPIKKPALPTIKNTEWPASPIDHFILAKLEASKLAATPAAERRTLIRRATYDLTGLPPTIEEVDAFLADPAADAFAKVVDRLLASSHYGERWGRHWLDVVRYSDSGGFEADYIYPNAWRYRDYVIRSLNADKPFDRFIQEQVAGDELWPKDPEAIVATGLYCVGPALEESAMVSNQLEYEWLTDAADTTGAAFLGLTFGCARCHDHKYDPITQKDYYSLQAIFAASDRPFPANVRTLRLKTLNGLLAEVPLPKKFENDPRCTVQTEEKVGFHLFHRSQPLEVRRLRRGELSKPAEKMGPAFPAVFLAADPQADFKGVPPTNHRATLARWLTSPNSPLTARVLVNRVWGWHFGQAIVRTPNDFGSQGELPSHPELLDWLAKDFMDHGWSLKRLHRLIMLSQTYQMRSTARGRGMAVDPENRLLWHFPRRRLEGEAIRDAMLACGGTLNAKAFGPAVVPPLSGDELTGLFDSKGKWVVTKDAAEHNRRSIYLFVRRTFAYPMFGAFDPPDSTASCSRRMHSIVPTQALTLLNSPVASAQSAAFAQRLLKECGEKSEKAAARAWLLAFGRPITAAESKVALTFLRQRSAALTVTGHGSAQGVATAQGPTDNSLKASVHEPALAELCLALFNANEFIYLD